MDTVIPTGSTSKWPSAMMVAGLVSDGTIASLDDPVHKYLPYWTDAKWDKRSKVTVRHLLTFTSGFGGGHPGIEGNSRAARQWRADHPLEAAAGREQLLNKTDACDVMKGDVSACAESIYHTVKLIGTPGQVYSYNSNHLQIAAALAVAASGLDIKAVIRKYLLEPYGMRSSYYYGQCPDFGATLMTNGDDYERFLHGLLSYSHPSKSVIDQSEADATPFMSNYYSLYGNYGFGHFLMCFDSWGGFTDDCKEARSHMDPGAFGYIPIIDRKHGFYMQVVAAETPPTGSYPLSGIPEYLAVAIKPHVEAIVSAAITDTQYHLHHTPSLLSLAIPDVNYIANCKLHPLQCM